MAIARKCDRCGKLFDPYNIDADYKVPNRYMNILLRNVLLVNETYKELGDYDLCKECNDSFLEWLSKPKVVKHECSNFRNIDKQNHVCKICPRHQECEEATKEKEVASKKKGVPECFGKYDGSNRDCLLCELTSDCEEK
mgnify:CR=1 FL=1|jgi:hypothetical protein